MLTPATLHLFGVIINYSYYMGAVPVYWDWTRGRLRHNPSWLRFTICLVNICVLLIQLLILIERLGWYLLGRIDDPILLVMSTVGFVGTTGPAISGLIFLFKSETILCLMTRILRYLQHSKDPSSLSPAIDIDARCRPSHSRRLEWMLRITLFMALTIPLSSTVGSTVVFLNPARRIFHTSLLPMFPADSMRATLYVQLGILYNVNISAAHAIIGFTFALVGMHGITSSFHTITPSPDKQAKISPSVSLFNYKCLHLLIAEFNKLCERVIPALIIILMALSTILSVGVMTYAHVLVLGLVPMVTILLGAAHGQFLMYNIMGSIYKASSYWIRCWRQYKFENRLDEALMRKYLKSCKPIAIRRGNYGPIRPITGLRVLSGIVFYSAKIALGWKLELRY